MRGWIALVGLAVAVLVGAPLPARADGGGNRWYFAEGTTRPGFQEYLALENSGPAAPITVTYQFADGSTRSRSLTLPGASRTTLDINQEVGPNRDVSMIVDAGSASGVKAERPVYFHACLPICVEGSHTAAGTNPATIWYFAEGFTGQGFQEYLSLQNPGSTPASVNLQYSFTDGSSRLQGLTLAPTSRSTIDVNAVLGPEVQVSTRVASDQPIVAERAMYFDGCLGSGHVCAHGGDDTPGATRALTWDFAEGNTGAGFQEYLLLLNPGDTGTTASIQYAGPGGPLAGGGVDLPAHSRRTVDVNAATGAGAVAIHLTSGLPIVAERALYRRTCNSSGACVQGGGIGPGLVAGGAWSFAEGYVGDGFQESLALFNPGSQPAMVAATFLGPGGTVSPSYRVPAGSRLTVPVDASGVSGPVSSYLYSDQPIVVERSMSFSGCLGAAPVCVNLPPPPPPPPPRPSQRTLAVPFIRQARALTCEAASLQMVLASRGVMTDQETIMGLVRIDRRPAVLAPDGSLRTWGNPNRTFVGDPDGREENYSGYGVYSGPIGDAATSLGAKVRHGGIAITPPELYDAILDGHPAVAWVTYDFRFHPVQDYVAFDGQTVGMVIPEHAVALAGVDQGSVLVNDPLRGSGWRPKSEFEASYASLGQMAVILD